MLTGWAERKKVGRGHWAKITKVGRGHWAEITVGRGHMYPSFFTIYHKRYWMMNVKIPHEEVTELNLW